MKRAMRMPPSTSSLPRCLLTLVNHRMTPAMIRKTTAAVPMSMAALSSETMTTPTFAENEAANPWIAGMMPDSEVEFDIGEACPAAIAVVVTDAASIIADITYHSKGR